MTKKVQIKLYINPAWSVMTHEEYIDVPVTWEVMTEEGRIAWCDEYFEQWLADETADSGYAIVTDEDWIE